MGEPSGKERKMKDLIEKYGVKQLGFHVRSIEESAELFAKLVDAWARSRPVSSLRLRVSDP